MQLFGEQPTEVGTVWISTLFRDFLQVQIRFTQKLARALQPSKDPRSAYRYASGPDAPSHVETIDRPANGRPPQDGACGWVAHHNTDIWGHTAPAGGWGEGDAMWVMWPMVGIWLAQHLWEHFSFGRDLVFLRKQAYPTMKEAALFCMDFLEDDSASSIPDRWQFYGESWHI